MNCTAVPLNVLQRLYDEYSWPSSGFDCAVSVRPHIQQGTTFKPYAATSQQMYRTGLPAGGKLSSPGRYRSSAG